MNNREKIIWLPEEINFLRENYNKKTNKELAGFLKKTEKNVGRTLKRLGLYKDSFSIKEIKTRRNKEVGRDLNFEFVSNVAKNYSSRGEFYQFDSVAYTKAIKNGWLDIICSHMVVKHISIPQLLLKDILEHMFDETCSYNDKKTIKPFELDCYFPKYKIAWEYDGKYFHNNRESDRIKDELCNKKGIFLFRINEDSPNYRKYVVNIKNQLIKQLDEIKTVTGVKIDKDKILTYKPKVLAPNQLTEAEKKLISGKKLKEIKKENIIIFKKIKKYSLCNDESLKIINDTRRRIIFNDFEEYLEHLRKSNYKSFSELCDFEHPYRLMKKFGKDINLIKEIFKK